MKLKYFGIAGLLSGILLFGAFYPNTMYEERESLILHAVLSFVKQVHVNPKPINDEFSKNVFDTYIERLDGGKRFLLQTEVDELSANRLSLDEEANDLTFRFFDQSVEVIDKAVPRAERIFLDLITNHKFDFDKEETFELDGEKKEFAKSESDLKDSWRRYLKYDIVQKFNRAKEKQDKSADKADDMKMQYDAGLVEKEEFDKYADVEIKSDEELLEKAIADSKENFEEWFERLNKLRRSDRFEVYLGSITNYFDPHTDYFNPKEKQDFDINMGGKLEGIGARLTPDGDFTKVSSIIPGGPAHKGKELEVNDLITAVTQEGGEPLDVVGWRLDDVVQKIRGKKGTIVTLTIQKTDGSIKDITIERDEVDIDDSFARSVLLDLPGTANNVGYIKLPKFYSSFEKEDGNSCAVDVANEIEKLKAEGANGIILDLRNNTGGSLSDVVDMSGLFIEDGPIVQVKPREKKPYVYRDRDEAVQYDGPLIIMTNHNSASASEILAAALQDYGRAIIVGSKSTFGKGSVQRFFDLDRAFPGQHEDMKPLGNLKISMQKFYRVNGESTQLKGVVPDIILPTGYHYIDTGEKEYDNALAWDEIDTKEFAQNVVELDKLSQIKALSEARVAEDPDFQLVLENAKRLKENRDFSNYPVSIEEYSTLQESRKEEAKKFEDLGKDDVEYLSIRNLAVDTASINSDESFIARNEDWIEGLKKDFYLEETLFILRDLINLEESYSDIEKKFVINDKKEIKP